MIEWAYEVVLEDGPGIVSDRNGELDLINRLRLSPPYGQRLPRGPVSQLPLYLSPSAQLPRQANFRTGNFLASHSL
jgi:hypothetical protein